MAVIDNCTTVIVLNNESLFVGQLKKISDFGIITVSGIDYNSTHIGTTRISIKDDQGEVYSITIPHTLYFPSSLVNVVSIGKMSLNYRGGEGNDGTYIKSTDNKL